MITMVTDTEWQVFVVLVMMVGAIGQVSTLGVMIKTTSHFLKEAKWGVVLVLLFFSHLEAGVIGQFDKQMVSSHELETPGFVVGRIGFSFLPEVLLKNDLRKTELSEDCVSLKPESSHQCTAFSLDSRHIVTAGHCVGGDFHDTLSPDETTKLGLNHFFYYDEGELVSSGIESVAYFRYIEGFQDFAVLRLTSGLGFDVEVQKNESSKSYNFLSQKGYPVFSLGYPRGHSLFESKGHLYAETSYGYLSDLDSFQGESGSPVLSSHSGKPFAMIVAGPKDFSFTKEKECSIHRTTFSELNSYTYLQKIDNLETLEVAEYSVFSEGLAIINYFKLWKKFNGFEYSDKDRLEGWQKRATDFRVFKRRKDELTSVQKQELIKKSKRIDFKRFLRVLNEL